MPELEVEWAKSLQPGAHRIFGFLQVDIAEHSNLPGSDLLISQTRDNLHRQVLAVLSAHGAQELAWAGDGGAFILLIEHGDEYDRLVASALLVLDSLRVFNWLLVFNRLGSPLHLRISCHMGPAIWDPKLSNLYSKSLNYFIKSERELGERDEVAITEEVFDQLSDSQLRALFEPRKEHSYMLRGQRYSRRIFVCSPTNRLAPRDDSPAIVPYPSPEELADLLLRSRTVEAVLAGGDSFYTKYSEALQLVEKRSTAVLPELRLLLRRSSLAAKRSAAKFRRLATKFGFKIAIAWCDYDFMLRGYCFDRHTCFFSYFLRENDILTGRQNLMLKLISGRSDSDEALLVMFTRTFDGFFHRPDSVEDNSQQLPFLPEA